MMDELQNRLKKRTSTASKPVEPAAPPPAQEEEASVSAPPPPAAGKLAPAKTVAKVEPPAASAGAVVPAWKQRAQAAKDGPKVIEEVVETDMQRLSRIMGAPIESEEGEEKVDFGSEKY